MVVDLPEYHKLRSGADDEQEVEGVGQELVDGHAVYVEGVVVEHGVGLWNAHVVTGRFGRGVLESALLLYLRKGVVYDLFCEAEVSVGLQCQYDIDESVDVEELFDYDEVGVGLLREGGLVLQMRGHLDVLGVVDR